ncbi:hypothetical protein BDV10DRAFT_166295 [Aspergillus recurvatus]
MPTSMMPFGTWTRLQICYLTVIPCARRWSGWLSMPTVILGCVKLGGIVNSARSSMRLMRR